ncbi:MAG TPA: amidohydrolase [Gemmatimonadaceae bacterium]|nr:amidohydrolase [Gemmatimonadaceae bacterium]
MRTVPRPLVAAATACAVALLASTACDGGADAADLVLRNGTIITLDSAVPEATALAARDGRIVAVGSDEEISRHIGGRTEVIDLDGATAVPGFIEGHGHFMSLGRARMMLDLTTARRWSDIVAQVGAAVGDAGTDRWIVGRGWHQEKWDEVPEGAVEQLPTHHALSAVSPNNPVLLTHASGHAAFANARALQLAGITRETPNPPGGEIVRDREGNPTGALRERAQIAVREAMSSANADRRPEDADAEARLAVELAGEDLLSKGITSFHDAGATFSDIDFFRRLADEGQLPVRLYVMVRRASNEEMERRLPEYRIIGAGNDYLTVRSIKRQIDGALGPHGAWLLQPYDDMRTSTGLVLEPVADIERTAEIAIQHGFQLNTHAIGDRGNREVLDIYERVFSKHPDATDLRWRIEHAQHLHPDDVPRFARLGVIAAMQGIHATSDAPWVYRRLGARRAESGAYLWRSLIDAGVVIANGTDVPVENADPIASYYASVSRRLEDGSVFFPGQRMTREEALRSYTINNAYAAFEEESKGTLSPGKLADIAVLSQNILTVDENRIPETRVLYTIVGGQVRHRADGAPGGVTRR